MNTKRLAPPLLIALSVSGVCTFLLSRKLQHHGAEEIPTVQYAVLTRPLEAGDVLAPDNLHLATWPATSAVPGAFTRTADLVGRAVLYPVNTNQPLTDRLVSEPGAGAGLAGRIPSGMRAIALKSDEVVGVAGFLLPGSHVDVLVTYRSGTSPDPRTVNVVQNAQVIAAGQKVQPDPTGKPATVDVVTLLMSPADAERAVLASAQGTVHFVLRGGADQSRTNDDGILLSDFSAVDAAAQRVATQRAAAQAAAATPVAPSAAVAVAHAPKPAAVLVPAHQTVVETISGDKQVTASFPDGGR